MYIYTTQCIYLKDFSNTIIKMLQNVQFKMFYSFILVLLDVRIWCLIVYNYIQDVYIKLFIFYTYKFI